MIFVSLSASFGVATIFKPFSGPSAAANLTLLWTLRLLNPSDTLYTVYSVSRYLIAVLSFMIDCKIHFSNKYDFTCPQAERVEM